jgi:AraC-like DNA-binding protein
MEVALDVGYNSEAAFNRAFKRTFQAPPAQFRHSRKAN